MTSRERMLVLALGVMALGGVGYAGYALVAKPILNKRQELADLDLKVELKTDEFEKTRKRNKQKLDEYHRRSLPAEEEFAWREYQDLLERLLDEAKAPPGTSITRDNAHASVAGVPLLYPDDPMKKDKTPAYKKIAYKIEMKKADLAALTGFLTRYYQTNLLHQISLLEVKRDGQGDLGEDKRWAADRDDLQVTVVTEAVILNGAPARRTILPIPSANAAVLGGAGLVAMQETPSVGRVIVPQMFEPILANKPARDYTLIAARDPFHGTLPTWTAPPPPAPKEEPIPPPKPDYGDLILYTTKIGTTQGDERAVKITIRDKINNEDYELELTPNGERVKVVVEKFEFNMHKADPTKRKSKMYREDTLEISKYTMRTRHKFTVYGLDGDALIVGEKPSGLAELTSAAEQPRGNNGGGGGRPGSGPNRTTTPKASTPPDPKAAVLGGAGAVLAQRAERFYRWEYGQPLSKIVELNGKEAEKAVQRAQSCLLPTPVEQSADAGK